MEDYFKKLLELLEDPNQTEETKHLVRELLEAERKNNFNIWNQLIDILRRNGK